MTNPPVAARGVATAEARAAAHPVRDAARGQLAQCRGLVASISDAAYRAPCPLLQGGTIGQHLRHTLDHYRALLDASAASAVVDYDHRDRAVPMESDRTAALSAIDGLDRRLTALDGVDLARPVTIRVMVSGDGACSDLASTVARELFFAMHHGVHHQAMMRAIAADQGVEVGAEFGRAPSTLNHDRSRP